MSNGDEIKEYLKREGIDERLAEGEFIQELFRDKLDDNRRQFVYINEKDGERYLTIIRDNHQLGHKENLPYTYKISKLDGNVLVTEIEKTKENEIYYSMDFPVSTDSTMQYTLKRKIYYLDKDADILQATETTSYKSMSPIKESDLDKIDSKIEINEDACKDISEGEYPMIKKLIQSKGEIEMEEKGHGKIVSIEVKALDTIIKYEDEYEVSLETFQVFGNNRTAADECKDEGFEQYGELTNYEATVGSIYGAHEVVAGKIAREDYSPKNFSYAGLDLNIVQLLNMAGDFSASKEGEEQIYDLLQAYRRVHDIDEPMQEGDQELISGILSFDLEGLDKVDLKDLNKDGADFSKGDLSEIKEEIANSALCCETSEIAQGINSEELTELISVQEMSAIKKALETFKQYVRNIKDKIFNKDQGER